MADGLGEGFARAFAAKDYARVREILAPSVDFRGMTPNRIWEESDPDAIIEGVLRQWLEDDELVDEVESVESGEVEDRESVRYRFRVRSGDDVTRMEQQVYYETDDGRITWMRVLCSGNRPVGR